MIPFSSKLLDDELAAHALKAAQSLVQVRTGRNGAGSGVIIHEDGLIITNAHVIRHGAPHIILNGGDDLRGRVLAYDEALDLAAVSANGAGLQALPLGDSARLRPGSLVIALGHPWGVVGAATAGMVIGVGRPLEPLPYNGELIQVGLQLRPGHSGGPMLDATGELVGLNTMIAGPQVGFAIPARTVSRFLKDNLGSTGRRRRKPSREAMPA
ncbi:MAG TPA: trypsin-like peptidase domain-containing protein [Candidatus Binatia bacterium]|jgi:S1-C subfamily serine protease|nr:trypsin-like peptidase domain-containing protein [Candidatus Binatia bacterium]